MHYPDQAFHNQYLLEEIFSYAVVGRRYCDFWSGDLVAKWGLLRVLSKPGLSFSNKAMDWAAENGHLHVVQWLHENRTEGCTTAMDSASRNGHLHVVQWLHANRTEGCTAYTMEWAALRGHLDIVQWLYQVGYELCGHR